MKTFVTIFPDAQDVHLIKDVGQIPYLMHKQFGYDATLLVYASGAQYRHLNDAVHGLKISAIAKGLYLRWFDTAVIWYLVKNGRRIDVLNLYHDTLATKLYSWIFKLVHPKGFLYVKLDGNAKDLETQYACSSHRHAVRSWLLNAVQRQFGRCVDCVSIETAAAYKFYRQHHPELEKKLILMPNGIDDQYALSKVIPVPFEQKENVILTVGRPGDPLKNTELLIRAASMLPALGSWKVCLVGPRTESFDQWLDDFLSQNPRLKDVIVLGGAVNSRVDLYRWYDRAKIFVLTSNREGFPLVFPEALFFGNVIISTDVSGAADIINDGDTGMVTPIDDAPALADALRRAISDDKYLKTSSDAATRHGREYFVWSKILVKLQRCIDGAHA